MQIDYSLILIDQQRASIISQHGQGDRLDLGNKDKLNLEVTGLDQSNNDILNVVLIFYYSKAKYKATLTKVGDKLEFRLGEPVEKDIHFYPRKPVP
ncbi:hypothetical protein [uncultured Roseivirga sp.]|uniref:hypothetical protein n=1 Tax=uncultured Roseivirga sp. TaxID=543088 RepID=UPI0030D81189